MRACVKSRAGNRVMLNDYNFYYKNIVFSVLIEAEYSADFSQKIFLDYSVHDTYVFEYIWWLDGINNSNFNLEQACRR